MIITVSMTTTNWHDYANAATDIEFLMPFWIQGSGRVFDSRTNFDLSQHEKFSRQEYQVFRSRN